MSRLLIIGCSRRKRLDPEPIPAIDRYDGPLFRCLRRYLAMHPAQSLRLFVLSAAYGLISADAPIPYYDERLATQRVPAMRHRVMAQLSEQIGAETFEEICVCAGHLYQKLLELDELDRRTRNLILVGGPSGKQLARLHDWLYGHGPSGGPLGPRAGTRYNKDGKAHEVHLLELSPEEVLDRARLALESGSGNPAHFYSWYVLIDGYPVAPKWLIAQLTGKRLSEFTTHDAVRLLRRLGIPVHHR
jgi:hypothetical protein